MLSMLVAGIVSFSAAAKLQKATTAGDEGVFGKSPDFNQQFLKLMENQNEILANIADELNLIRHAVLDVNGLTAITYVK